ACCFKRCTKCLLDLQAPPCSIIDKARDCPTRITGRGDLSSLGINGLRNQVLVEIAAMGNGSACPIFPAIVRPKPVGGITAALLQIILDAKAHATHRIKDGIGLAPHAIAAAEDPSE